MNNNNVLVHVVHCAQCIHNEEGECEMFDFTKVKPFEFCWWGRTANGREPKEFDAIPFEWIEKYAMKDDLAGSIYRMIEEWRKENAER